MVKRDLLFTNIVLVLCLIFAFVIIIKERNRSSKLEVQIDKLEVQTDTCMKAKVFMDTALTSCKELSKSGRELRPTYWCEESMSNQ